ncbi:MAG: hypothetical protein PVF69_06415 [Gemmatimonadota bacterium]
MGGRRAPIRRAGGADIFDALGNLGDFIGGIGVVITLAYLAIQVRQNTRALRTSSRQDVVDGYRTINRLMLDPAVAQIFSEGLSSFPDLPFAGRSTFAALMNEHALFFQGAFALYESGQLEDETYHAYREWIATIMAAPGGAAWWETARAVYARRVVAALDERLGRGGLANVLDFDGYRLDEEPGRGLREEG